MRFEDGLSDELGLGQPEGPAKGEGREIGVRQWWLRGPNSSSDARPGSTSSDLLPCDGVLSCGGYVDGSRT